MPLDPTLREVLKPFRPRSDHVTVDELFLHLLKSDAGHRFLTSRGMRAEEIQAAVHTVAAILASPWRGSRERQSAINALSPFGSMLTERNLERRELVGRKRDMAALVRTLAKMRRRNAILVQNRRRNVSRWNDYL